MNNTEIKDGTWATMLTPFTKDNKVDYAALGELIEWYIENGIDGLFAVCQSSEMFFLTAEERESVGRFTVEKAGGRIPVVISGHVSDDIREQISELKRAESCGGAAVVLVTNRLAEQEESEEVWKENAEKILSAMPEAKFGLYECPYPYKRLVSPELLKWCADTGRFVFLKDTCCNAEQIRAKLEAVKGTGLKLFNANTPTLTESLRGGANGFCGIMLNFFPEPFELICRHYNEKGWENRVELLQNFATAASLLELRPYPINAKYNLSEYGLNIETASRSRGAAAWSLSDEIETDGVRNLCRDIMKIVNSENG